jgi:signal peptidase II
MSLPRLQHATVTDSRAGLARLTGLVAVAVFLTDVASKNWALEAASRGQGHLGPTALTVVQNDGLAFSIGAGVLDSPAVLALRLAVLGVVLLLAWRFGPERHRFAVGFALVLGGGLGNAADVMLRDGAVVDFIHAAQLGRALGGTPTHGPVFNLADLWILVGLALLFPLFRILGLAVQRRLQAVEGRLLGREWDGGASA